MPADYMTSMKWTPRKTQTNELTQEGIENINKLITNKENELVIKSLLQRKTPAQMASLVSSIKCLERSSINPSQMMAKIKNKSRANTSQLILWGH